MKVTKRTTAVNFLQIFTGVLLCTSWLYGQRMDSFEGGAPRWLLVESDCEARLVEHDISLIMPRSGRGCEIFEINCTSGSAALMAYPIEPCAGLNEFQPSVWIRCASGQIRVGVRVVFPNAVHPISQSRLTAIIWGDSYSQPGSWQRLQVTRVADRLQQEIIGIRKRFDQSIDLEQPYVDSLVLNAYTGPGRYRVQVDDLDLQGMIPLTSFGVPLSANWRQRWRWREVVERNFAAARAFPVWVQQRGEQPAWLASMGFSGLLLSEFPTATQLAQIHEAGVQVISPPPSPEVEFDSEHLTRLTGWMVGSALNRDQTDLAKRMIERADRLPAALRRPTIGEPLEHFWQYSRLMNQTIVPAPDPVSAGELAGKRHWLSSTINQVQLRGDGWVSIQANVNPAVEAQVKTAIERIDPLSIEGAEADFSLADPVGLRREVIAAVMAGAKGVVYRTQHSLIDPLSYQGPKDRALQAAMRWVNQDMRLWAPWITTGQLIAVPQLDRSDFSAVRWRLKDSDLILIQNTSPESQWCMPPTRSIPLQISVSDSNAETQAIRLTEGRMEALTGQVSRGSRQWQIENPNSAEFVVLTHHPQVLSYLRRTMEQMATNNASDQLDIAAYCLQLASELMTVRFRHQSLEPGSDRESLMRAYQRRLSAIDRRLQAGWQSLQSQQTSAATAHAMVVIDQAQQVMHEGFSMASRDLSAPQSSPFVLVPAALKFHWMIAEACSRSQWKPMSIPGSQFTDLSGMLAAGWSQQRRSEERFDWRVELVPQRETGSAGLRMAAYAKQEPPLGTTPPGSPSRGGSPISVPGGYEGASLRVRSAAIKADAGQFIRVTAKAHIRHCDEDPSTGLLFYDNQAGPSLGQLVRGAPGDSVDIELYRFVLENGQFRLLAECRGECDIQLSDLVVAIIDPATERSSFDTNPLVSDPVSSYPLEIP